MAPGTDTYWERKKELQEGYDRAARWFDLMEVVPEILGLKRLRRRCVGDAYGKVLEVAVGTGKNLRHYSLSCRVTAGDLSPGMLNVARKRTHTQGLDIVFLVMDGEALPFPDQCFDTVVSSLTLCTFPDPVAALQEMARVCRFDGRILLLEHGRSSNQWLGSWQDVRADRHAKALGCRWNREPLDLVRQAGLRLVSGRRTFFGIFHEIQATPSAPP